MALQPAPSASSASRGETSIQPAYFTSSLFVNAVREDIDSLLSTYTQAYAGAGSSLSNPYALFKDLWKTLGWRWLHLKTLEARSRVTFLNTVLRLFLERTISSEDVFVRTGALFGLYTFFMSQPSSSGPPMASVSTIPIPLDDLEALLGLPGALGPSAEHFPLQDQVSYIIHSLTSKQVFAILPSSALHAQNPRVLPREIVQIGIADSTMEETSVLRKTGRPSRSEKSQKSRLAVNALNVWTEINAFPSSSVIRDPAGAPSADDITEGDFVLFDNNGQRVDPLTHRLLSERPLNSLNEYRAKKDNLINNLSGTDSLARANAKVLNRVKEIDALAAEQGLEVGGEGGDRSGLERIEKAVSSMDANKKGLLGLLEGGGLET